MATRVVKGFTRRTKSGKIIKVGAYNRTHVAGKRIGRYNVRHRSGSLRRRFRTDAASLKRRQKRRRRLA